MSLKILKKLDSFISGVYHLVLIFWTKLLVINLILDKKQINILLVSTSDIRHVLKTCADHQDKMKDT